MRCEKVLGQLSAFLDGMLQDAPAAGVTQHLKLCSDCNAELIRLKELQGILRSWQPIETPDYLRDLVELKISRARGESWSENLRYSWERWWSRVRTTESSWYWTRLMGVMATVVFFIAIYAAMNPLDLGLAGQIAGPGWPKLARPSSQDLAFNVQKALGSVPVEAQKKPIRSSAPKINDLYLLNFGESVSRTAHDDTVSIYAVIDSSGALRIQNVLVWPDDDSLLSNFADMIMSAGWRPASQNGRAVDSRLVLTFSTIYVYN